MAKRCVAVLMGGMSSEHDVSMRSGQMVVEHLDPKKYKPIPVSISREGEWSFDDGDPVSIFKAVEQLGELKPDCVFPALHGVFGEDGRIQALLDLLDVPYPGSGCAASALALDKIRSKAIVEHAGIRVAKQLLLTRNEWEEDARTTEVRVAALLGFPCVVKNPWQGSSLGMAIPRTQEEFADAVNLVLGFGDVVMVEQFLEGTEVTCGVLDVDIDEPPVPLPVTEICPVEAAYFDYEAKYTDGATKEITPARIHHEVAKKVQETAVWAHQAIGCETWSRSDMIIVEDETYWLEVNTIPGMTKQSLFPQAAAAMGIDYTKLLDMFIESAIQKKTKDN